MTVRRLALLIAGLFTITVTEYGYSQSDSTSLEGRAMAAARVILADDSASLVDKMLAAKVLGLEQLARRYERQWVARYRGIPRIQSLLELIGATEVGIDAERAYDLINGPGGAAAFLDAYADELRELERQNPSAAKSLRRVLPLLAHTPPEFTSLIGASVVAEDGQFLGIVADCLSPQSICNEIGPHGGAIWPSSIHNSIGEYGGSISSMSPYNPLASSPPRLVKGDRTVAFLTKNIARSPAVDPDDLIQWLKSGRTPALGGYTWLEDVRALGGPTIPAELGFSLSDVERRCEVYKYSENYGEFECRSDLRLIERKCEVYFADGGSGEISCSGRELDAVESRCSVYMYSDNYGDIDCS